MSMSSRSGSSSNGTSRPASAISAVSRVRPKREWTQSSRGRCAICCPRSRASSRPFGVRATGTEGSPLTRFSKLSVDSPCRAITYRSTAPRIWRRRRPASLWSNGRVATQVEELPDNKVPLPVLLSRIGKERLYTEAIESHISAWYGNAVARSGIRPADQPELEYELPASDDEDWRFRATVSVLPKPTPADWTKLQVPYVEPEVPADLVEHELNVLRSTVAGLSPVEDRSAQAGDTVVVDLLADDSGQRDYVVELGSGRLVPELEEQLIGMSSGETRDIQLERADGTQPAQVQAVMKEIKEKGLPPLDDELARSASEFDTLDDLRADVEGRLRAQIEAEVDEAFRRATLDRLVEASDVRVS